MYSSGLKELDFLEQQAFELITNRLESILTAQGYTLIQSGKTDSNRPSLFFGGANAYAVVYEKKAKRFELRQATLNAQKEPGEWKNMSEWLFDPATDSLKEAESIANDFCQSVEVASIQKQLASGKKAKREKTEEKYVNPAFLMKRFIPIFPDFTFVIQAHREKYGAVIPHAMCREFLVPMMNELLKKPREKQRQSRFFDVLSHNYENGDLDTKSLITLGILNYIEDEESVKLAEGLLSEELKKAWICARKYKGKKVKPEKVKKRAKLNAQKSTGSLV